MRTYMYICMYIYVRIKYVLHLFQRHQMVSVVEHSLDIYLKQKLFAIREKCPKTELFLVRIFLYSVRIQGNTDQKKLRIWTLFTQSCDVRSEYGQRI